LLVIKKKLKLNLNPIKNFKKRKIKTPPPPQKKKD